MITEENLLKRINELLQLQFQGRFDVLGEIYTGTVGVASQIWGAVSKSMLLNSFGQTCNHRIRDQISKPVES